MKIKEFFKKRKWLTFLILLIGIGFLIYFIFKLPQPVILKQELLEELKKDKTSPNSYIFLPDYSGLDTGSWETSGYISRPIIDKDNGGSGLDRCTHSAFDNIKKTFTLSRNRPCNSLLTIRTGPDTECSSQGENACILYVHSQDRAGNVNVKEGEGKGFTVYSVDWEPPMAGKAYVTEKAEDQSYPIKAEKGQILTFKASVSDKVGVSNCDFLINGESQYPLFGYMEFSDSSCNDCIVSKNYSFNATGRYEIRVRCADRIPLVGVSPLVEVFVNHEKVEKEIEREKNRPPLISSCRVSPTKGTPGTEFQFRAEVSDPDNDPLFYSWDFGDGESSDQKNSTHYYRPPGTYEPKVTVFDDKEGKAVCSTAWVVVSEE